MAHFFPAQCESSPVTGYLHCTFFDFSQSPIKRFVGTVLPKDIAVPFLQYSPTPGLEPCQGYLVKPVRGYPKSDDDVQGSGRVIIGENPALLRGSQIIGLDGTKVRFVGFLRAAIIRLGVLLG